MTTSGPPPDASGVSVLALHGLGGTPASLGHLPEGLARRGHEVLTPMLTGHGTHPDALGEIALEDWRRDLDTALGAIPTRVVVVGQSLGGVLAILAAADHGHVGAVVCINAPAVPGDPEVIDHLEMLTRAGHRIPTASTFEDPEARDVGYEEVPARALVALVRAGDLAHRLSPEITIPALIVTSRHDDVVDPFTGDDLATRWGGEVERLVLDRGGHVAALDLDREVLLTAIAGFVDRVSAGWT